MKTTYLFCIVLVTAGFSLAACMNDTTVPMSAYSTKIIGGWQGAIGEQLKEDVRFNSDNTFVCHVQGVGFLSSTLSQTLPGTIRGTWKINGDTLTLSAVREKHVELENNIASGRIIRFKQDSLVLKSDAGDIAVFLRVLHI